MRKHALWLAVGGVAAVLAGQVPAAPAEKEPPGEAALEVVVQVGHSSNIQWLGFTPDGRYLVSKDSSGTTLWDLATGRELRRYQTNCFGITPDGQQMVAAYYKIGFWDLVTGRKLREIGAEAFGSWAMSAAGRRIIGGSKTDARAATVWDAAEGRKLWDLPDHRGELRAVALSPDGRWAATGSGGDDPSGQSFGELYLWDLTGGQATRTLDGHKNLVWALAFSPDGRLLLSGSLDGSAILWDVETGRKIHTLVEKDRHPNHVAFSPDGRRAVLSSIDPTISVWNVDSGLKLRQFESKASDICKAAFSPDSRSLAGGLQNGTVLLWDVESGNLLRTFGGHVTGSRQAAFDPEGRRLAVATGDKSAVVWDLASGTIARVRKGHTDAVIAVAYSPDGQQVVTGSNDHTAIVWDAATGAKLHTLTDPDDHSVTIVRFRSDGRQILTVSHRILALWDASTGQSQHVIRVGEPGEKTLQTAVFSPDGRQIAGWTFPTNELILWDTATGQKLRTLATTAGPGSTLAFSPDGQQVVAGLWSEQGGRQTVTYDVATGRELRALPEAFIGLTPDGRQLITSGKDTTVFRDATTGQEVRQVRGCWHGTLRPDGRWIACCRADRGVELCDPATVATLANLITLDDARDWVVVSPAGLFDGSAGGREKISYRIGDGLNVVPVDRFFQDFFRPGLLASIYAGDRPAPQAKIGKSLPPSLKILGPAPGTLDKPQAAIEVEATDRGGGVAHLAIYLNGSRMLCPGESRKQGPVVRRTFEIPLVEGENRIEVRASSGDGSWECEPAAVVLRFEKPLDRPELYLTAVGVNRYAEGTMNLKFAAADARAIAEIFRQRAPKLYGAEHTHVVELLDQQATKPGILDALKTLASKAKAQDTVVVFLAGHGTMAGQRYYFIPHEFRGTADKLEDDIRRQGLAGDEIDDAVSRLAAVKRVVIYDTCQSGGAVGLSRTARNPFAFRKALEAMGRAQGSFIIAATAATADAQEVPDLGHGVLSYALLAGLGGVGGGPLRQQAARPSEGDVLTVRDWFAFAQDKVPTLTRLYFNEEQFVKFVGSGSDFPLLPLKKE